MTMVSHSLVFRRTTTIPLCLTACTSRGRLVGEAIQWSCKVQDNEIVSCSARMNGLAVSDGAYRGGGHHLGEFVGSGTFV